MKISAKKQKSKGLFDSQVFLLFQDKFVLVLTVFKVSALWADAFYKSKCPSVCPSVCLSVCSLLNYHINVFLPSLPEVGFPKKLEIWNHWGKVLKRSGLRFEHFCLEVV